MSLSGGGSQTLVDVNPRSTNEPYSTRVRHRRKQFTGRGNDVVEGEGRVGGAGDQGGLKG